jgi:DNA-binding response OmpR family regulator
LRFLVIGDDPQFACWLRHRIEALCEDWAVDTESIDDFERRLALASSANYDLLIAVLRFSIDAVAHGAPWLERLRDVPDLPQFMVIAEDGDELTAAQSMRLGAMDYLPRRLITPELLRAGIRLCLEQRPERGAAAAAPPGVAPATAAKSLPRELIPRYKLLDVLGESPRAAVYLAASEALNRNVALKVSHRSETDEAQFSREYAAIGAMRHPSVVDIYDYGVFDGREYIAMEYFPCGDLKARIQNPITEDEAIDYLKRRGSPVRHPWRRHPASRPEAAEHHAARGRPGGADRFRTGQEPAQRHAQHGSRRTARLAVLHESGAGAG